MSKSTRENIVDGEIWVRALHMIIFCIAYNIVELALALTAIFQFFSALFTGKVNEPLLTFSKNASIYVQEVFEFLTFNSEIRPFPFTAWPDEKHTGEEWLVEPEEVMEAEEAEMEMEVTDSAPAEKPSTPKNDEPQK